MRRKVNNSQKPRLPKRDVGAILVPRQRPGGSSQGVTVGQKVPREYVHADQLLSCHYISFLFQLPTTTHPPNAFCSQLHSTFSHACTYCTTRQHATITHPASKIDRNWRPAVLHAAPSETRGRKEHPHKRIPEQPHRRGARGAVRTQRAHPSRDVSARQAFEFRDPRRNVPLPSPSPALFAPRRGCGCHCCRSASSSHFIKQLEDQQAAIRSRLNDLGVEGIRSQLEHTKIEEEESMSVDPPPPPPGEYRPIGAKARALARWVRAAALSSSFNHIDICVPADTPLRTLREQEVLQQEACRTTKPPTFCGRRTSANKSTRRG